MQTGVGTRGSSYVVYSTECTEAPRHTCTPELRVRVVSYVYHGAPVCLGAGLPVGGRLRPGRQWYAVIQFFCYEYACDLNDSTAQLTTTATCPDMVTLNEPRFDVSNCTRSEVGSNPCRVLVCLLENISSTPFH